MIWLPPYHDMGLIGGILQPIYTGFPCYLMSPVSLFSNPFSWLQAVSCQQATFSGRRPPWDRVRLHYSDFFPFAVASLISFSRAESIVLSPGAPIHTIWPAV